MEQMMPNGNDVLNENESDFALLKNDLITDEEQLSRILSKHNNVTFRIACAQYAARMGWKNFDFTSKLESSKEFVRHIFQQFRFAVQDGGGLAYLQYVSEKGEIQRIARNFGLEREYAAGLEMVGESIDTE